MLAKRAYLTFPRQVEFFKAAPVQRDQEVGARVAVGEGEAGGGHFFSRGGGSGAGVWWGPGGSGVSFRYGGIGMIAGGVVGAYYHASRRRQGRVRWFLWPSWRR